jgi:hypothetical protein
MNKFRNIRHLNWLLGDKRAPPSSHSFKLKHIDSTVLYCEEPQTTGSLSLHLKFFGGKFSFIISFLLGSHNGKKWLLSACVCEHAVGKIKVKGE